MAFSEAIRFSVPIKNNPKYDQEENYMGRQQNGFREGFSAVFVLQQVAAGNRFKKTEF